MKWLRIVPALVLLALGTAFAAPGDEGSIKRRIEEIKDSDTSAWRKIPWTASLLAGRKASAAEKKPMFLFTHDGNIETGRC